MDYSNLSERNFKLAALLWQPIKEIQEQPPKLDLKSNFGGLYIWWGIGAKADISKWCFFAKNSPFKRVEENIFVICKASNIQYDII